MEPAATLLQRIRAELSADFVETKPIRLSRAPGRLDVMGGIADYTGSLVCEMPLDRAAAVALQERDDRQVRVISFNLLDEHQPFTFTIPLDRLAEASIEDLNRELAEPGRRWAGYIIGCLAILQQSKLTDLKSWKAGINLALYSTIPLGAGISSSAAIEIATMINLLAHIGRIDEVEPMQLAAMAQQVENRIVGAPCGIMDQVTSCYGQEGALLKILCQPHEIKGQLQLPEGIRVIGINSNVKHSVGGGMYGVTRCAAFMGHKMILERMREMGKSKKRELSGDPMNGYLANLKANDYKNFFRPHLPEFMKGEDFLSRYDSTIDAATKVDPEVKYHVQHATDHHVLEAERVRKFVEFLERAAKTPARTAKRSEWLDKAGHLMYASHLSYTNDAMLGAEECDQLVNLVRERERSGLYGAKITGGGSGGTVAILCNITEKANAAIAEIMQIYESHSGHKPEAFLGSSPGAWHLGTKLTVHTY
jgi:galactokinase